jgi:hypothetical protein
LINTAIKYAHRERSGLTMVSVDCVVKAVALLFGLGVAWVIGGLLIAVGGGWILLGLAIIILTGYFGAKLGNQLARDCQRASA